MWFSKDAEAFLPAAVTLGASSDNTTPRCQLVASSSFFCLFQTLILLHWVRPDPSRRHRFIRSRESRNTVTTGPVGRGELAWTRKRLQSQQHFSVSSKFSGDLETGPYPPGTFVGTRLHRTGRLIDADRPGRLEPPGSTRCSMPPTSQFPHIGTAPIFSVGTFRRNYLTAFFSALAARFSSSDLAGFFLVSFFWSLPLVMTFPPDPQWLPLQGCCAPASSGASLPAAGLS